MADPLLTSLCTICHTELPKYTCPRCSSRTCSLACSKKHKLWASCNGIRDPTVYKPKRELCTPAGVDHDYNFLSAIERDVGRRDREIVEERGLVGLKELFGNEERPRRGGRNGRDAKDRQGDVERHLRETISGRGVDVKWAPKGMQRKLDNGTRWSKPQSCVNWTVEWMVEGADGVCERKMGTSLEKWPVEKVYGEGVINERRKGLSKGKRKQDREEAESRKNKRRRLSSSTYSSSNPIAAQTILQHPATGAWNLVLESLEQATGDREDEAPEWKEVTANLHFYLLRPDTPSHLPKVLIPISKDQKLSDILRGKTILEFPTIYVLTIGPDKLGKRFLTEIQYINRKRAGAAEKSKRKGLVEYNSDEDEDEEDEEESTEGSGSSGEDEDEDDEDAASTSSEDDEDEDMEDGEIV